MSSVAVRWWKCQLQSLTAEECRRWTQHLPTGGKLPHALNIPTEEWDKEETADRLLAEARERGVSKLVFTCGKSQQRGPKCAAKFLSRVSQLDGGRESMMPIPGN
jgi:hypothetical protein